MAINQKNEEKKKSDQNTIDKSIAAEKDRRMKFDTELKKSCDMEEVRQRDSLLMLELACKQEEVRRLNVLRNISLEKLKLNQEFQNCQENLHQQNQRHMEDVRN